MTGWSSSTDPWVTVEDRLAAFARMNADGVLPEVPCPACGYPTLNERGGDHVCIVCHWEDDGTPREQPDRRSPVNLGLTLREAARHIAEQGVYALPRDARAARVYFRPVVRAARDHLVEAYERLLADPGDTAARADVVARRAGVMRAIINELR